MFLYLNYPSWIHPEIIPGFGILRWYGLMYLVAFAVAFILFRRQAKEGLLGEKVSDDDIYGFFWWGIVGLILGARIFSTLVYEPTGKYWRAPWLIFWPFDENMRWTGLQGMSYHGGFIGGVLGVLLWCIKHKKNFFKWGDALAVAIPLGYGFGRLGNFLNGELYGRVTTNPLGMVFPQAEKFSISLPWVQEVMEKIGMNVPEGQILVNLPRHPSQLYEALFEGLILWLLLWFIFRKRKPFDGFLIGLYTIGYGTVRFFIEYLRAPDADIGYRIAVTQNPSTELFESFWNISTGQILCFLMIVLGIAYEVVLYFLYKKKILK